MSLPDPPFALTHEERHSPMWARLKSHLEDRLDRKRRENDRPLTEMQTATLRGHIECLKGIISLSDDRPTLTGDRSAP